MDNFNLKDSKERRKYLRNNMPNAEKILWYQLKGRQLNGFKFRRQFGVGKYIVDFYCPEVKLVIEIDGDSHFEPDAIVYDKKRELFIENQGIKVIRFTNNDIYETLDEVIKSINQILQTRNPS